MEELELAIRLSNLGVTLALASIPDRLGLSLEAHESFQRALLSQAAIDAQALADELLAKVSPEQRAALEEDAAASSTSPA